MLGGSRGRTSTSIQERRGLFWVRHEHLFPAKNRQNRKFYNRLTTKDMLRVFMGSTTTSTIWLRLSRTRQREIRETKIHQQFSRVQIKMQPEDHREKSVKTEDHKDHEQTP